MTHLGHSDPLLYDASSLCCSRGGHGARCGVCRRTQQGHDDLVGDGVELGDGGPDGGGHVLLLVSLRPDAAQTLIRQNFDEQSLRRHEEHHRQGHSLPRTTLLHKLKKS